MIGQQEGHPACKTLGVGSLVVTICTSYSSGCHHHLHDPQLEKNQLTQVHLEK